MKFHIEIDLSIPHYAQFEDKIIDITALHYDPLTNRS